MKRNKSVFVVGRDAPVNRMFINEGWDVVKDPNYADFLCFTGGADVSPDLYGEINEGKSFTDPRRDTAEVALYNQFKGKGMIGICRGGQFLNVMNGGKLRQHIEGHSSGYQKCNFVARNGETGDRVLEVHEDHHQEILPTAKARVFLKAINDGVVEGCWYGTTESFCFQPHPEWGHGPTERVFFGWLYNFYTF